ncbi:hypothetical protein TELCIR_02032 [Teladorsagia circumcincta]|uniref:Uncharacterized protein n=1 Tax=Teladorsagia circumcincta TaxID=45464 RepID=A0A2G9V0A2_TELCI|nr:hypothetical protein TELCIR_02032 [Teladorsagia circumcincta]
MKIYICIKKTRQRDLCSILLFTKAHAGDTPFSDYQCKKNVPEELQALLLEAINERREEVPTLKPLEKFNCDLAKEAFTRRAAINMHDGFDVTVEREINVDINQTLIKAVEAVVPYKVRSDDLVYPHGSYGGWMWRLAQYYQRRWCAQSDALVQI